MADRSKNVRTRSRGTFRVLPLGDAAVTIEFGDAIDPRINARVVAFAASLATQRWKGIRDVVPTYRSVTIHFDPLHWDSTELLAHIQAMPQPRLSKTARHGTLHEIPVLYGGEWGPDLEDLATFAGMEPSEAITLHASVQYRVYMLGFSPGFPYLGLVPKPLAMPRLSVPRTNVPAGSIGIADRQTGMYPSATPGGWRLIGRTPLPCADHRSPNPFSLKAGDLVQFRPIDQDEYDRLSREEAHADH